MDEHYYGTALSVNGKQWETDCKGVITDSTFQYALLCFSQLQHVRMCCARETARALLRQNRGSAPKEHLGRELNSGYLSVAMEAKWWHGKATCATPDAFETAAAQFISLNVIKSTEQARLLASDKTSLPCRRPAAV